MVISSRVDSTNWGSEEDIAAALVNYESGALDQRYSESWETLPAAQQWWLAVTKTVGPAPTLAPGVLGQSALLLVLASAGSTRRREVEPVQH